MRTSHLSRRAGTYLMRILPVQAYGRMIPREVIGLCYHVASDRALPHVRHLYAYKTVQELDADFAFLRRAFRVVSHAELVEAREAGRSLGPNAVYLSFDDGYAECFSVVRPLLLKHGLPCTFFVTTGALDNRRLLAFNTVSLCLDAFSRLDAGAAAEVLREMEGGAGRPLATVADFAVWVRRAIRDPESGAGAALERLCARLGVDVEGFLERERPYLTTDQVRQLHADGFTIGGHTRTHPHIGSTTSRELAEAEIVDSCRVVREITGAARVPFAFPYDAVGTDRAFLRDLQRRHPWIAPWFGTGRLQVDGDRIVNRMLADSPPNLVRGRTNLPGILRSAYLDEVLARVRMGGGAAAAAHATAALAQAATAV